MVLPVQFKSHFIFQMHLRNEFDFWKVHGIMNTSGLLQSKRETRNFMFTLQETRSIHDSMFGFHVNFARDPRYS